MTIKAQYTLACLSLVFLNVSCSGKSESNSQARVQVAKNSPENAKAAQVKAAAAKEAKDKAAKDKVVEKPAEATKAPEAPAEKKEDKVAGSPQSVSGAPVAPKEAAAPTVPSTSGVEIAGDSEEIRKSTVDYKLAFVNLAELVRISEGRDLVIHQQKVIPESEVSEKLKQLNEDNYCKVAVKGNFNAKDYLKMQAPEKKDRIQIDSVNDIWESTTKFSNKNGDIDVICTHTTSNLYLEDFQKNLQQIVNLHTPEGRVLDIKDYRNPRTENRMLNAIKIIDLEKLENVVMTDKKEILALFEGETPLMDDAVAKVQKGSGQYSCSIPWVSGTLSKDKVYIVVEKGLAGEFLMTDVAVNSYSIYRDDAGNYFPMVCLAKKVAPKTAFMETAKGVFQFGALERLEYNKVYDDIMAAHKKAGLSFKK